MKKAFTLAEVMITLTIIGVISAIVIPVAIHSKPDENIMKFKKGHNTLYQVIQTLVSSDKYYLDGDLGVKADGTEVVSFRDTVYYFCETIADLLTTKKKNCTTTRSSPYGAYMLSDADTNTVSENDVPKVLTVTSETIHNSKVQFDNSCKVSAANNGDEIVTTDGISYFQVSSMAQLGAYKTGTQIRIFSAPNQKPPTTSDEQGFDIAYKIYCMDVDGIPDNATEDDCVNECPFGYGIRADGKIMTGARADEWLAKDIQGEN